MHIKLTGQFIKSASAVRACMNYYRKKERESETKKEVPVWLPGRLTDKKFTDKDLTDKS